MKVILEDCREGEALKGLEQEKRDSWSKAFAGVCCVLVDTVRNGRLTAELR